MREEARIALRLIMEYESEESYTAGWLVDLEFILWARVLRRGNSPDEVADVLAWLAEEAGGAGTTWPGMGASSSRSVDGRNALRNRSG